MLIKRVILLLILLHLFSNLLFSSEESEYLESNNLTSNLGISFLYPLNKKTGAGLNVLASAVYLSGAFGVGKHLTIIPNILIPGIYGDVHFSLVSILLAQGGGSINPQDSNGDKNSLPFIFQGGLCLYNQFRFGSFDIQPSIGFNAIMGQVGTGILTKYGILIAYGSIGLEYSYQQPLSDSLKNDLPYLHRLVFVYHVR